MVRLQRIGVCGWVLAFAAFGSSAKAADGETVYRFDNSKVEIVIPGTGEAGAYIKQGWKKTWITEDPLLMYPGKSPGSNNPWEMTYDPNGRVVALAAENGVWAVTPHGAHSLPIDFSKIDYTTVDGRRGPNNLRLHLFEYGGRSHLLISVFYEQSERVGAYDGETFLVREDGVWFRMALSAVTLKPNYIHLSEDGMLDVDGIPRPIDLDKLEIEARLPIGAPFVVRDSEGNIVNDPIEKAKEEFPNVLEQIRNGSLRTFSFLPGEENTVEGMRLALAQEESGSLVLLGEAGSGKSQLGYSFLAEVVRNAYPEIPRSIQVVALDRGVLEQGTKFTGAFESKVATLKYLSRWAPLYIFADEVHALRGAGTHAGSNVDFFEMIKPELTAGSIRIIGTSTDTEFYRAFAGNAPILRRVSPVKMPARNETQTLEALKGWIDRFKKPPVSDEVLRFIYRTSERFSATGAQPSKASKLLDYVFARMRVQSKSGDEIRIEDVEAAAQHLYRLPPTHFDASDAVRRHYDLRPALDAQVIGQTAYKDAIVHANGMKLTQLQGTRRPGMRLLVVGPTGVGKTATAEAYAQAEHAAYHRVEMSKYQGRGADVEAFRRELAEALRKDPFSVICLDELEKADSDVLLGLLSIFDDGYFNVMESLDSSLSSQSATSVRVDTTKARFIATSNAAADWVAAWAQSEPARKPIGFAVPTEAAVPPAASVDVDSVAFQHALRAQLIAFGIPSALLGRFGVVTVALPPTRDEFKATIRLHTEKLLASLPNQGASKFTITNWDAFLDAMAARYYVGVVQNRIVHTLLDTHLNPVLLHISLEEMRQGTKGKGHYELTWTGADFASTPTSECEQLLLPQKPE